MTSTQVPATVGALARQWHEAIAAWALPPAIEQRAPSSPHEPPVALFRRRADQAAATAPRATPTLAQALDALDPPGTVLDVGAGVGAASLPLAPRTVALTAVDGDPSLLAELVERARGAGVPARPVLGRWPEVAPRVPVADVVVCAHVLYGVADLVRFAAALTSHARRRVVCELTARHPLAHLNPLWRRFHAVERPQRPTAAAAAGLLAALGLDVTVERWRPAPLSQPFDELVGMTRRRLCLPDERDHEVAAALEEAGFGAGGCAYPLSLEEHVTLSWPGGAGEAAVPADGRWPG